jgi:hypothetical protein
MLFWILYVRPGASGWSADSRSYLLSIEPFTVFLTRTTYQDSDSLTEGENLHTSLRQVRLAGLFDSRKSLFGTFPIQNFSILC